MIEEENSTEFFLEDNINKEEDWDDLEDETLSEVEFNEEEF